MPEWVFNEPEDEEEVRDLSGPKVALKIGLSVYFEGSMTENEFCAYGEALTPEYIEERLNDLTAYANTHAEAVAILLDELNLWKEVDAEATLNWDMIA